MIKYAISVLTHLVGISTEHPLLGLLMRKVTDDFHLKSGSINEDKVCDETRKRIKERKQTS